MYFPRPSFENNRLVTLCFYFDFVSNSLPSPSLPTSLADEVAWVPISFAHTIPSEFT